MLILRIITSPAINLSDQPYLILLAKLFGKQVELKKGNLAIFGNNLYLAQGNDKLVVIKKIKPKPPFQKEKGFLNRQGFKNKVNLY